MATGLTPGRCPLWGRRTPGVLDSTPGRLDYRKDRHGILMIFLRAAIRSTPNVGLQKVV